MLGEVSTRETGKIRVTVAVRGVFAVCVPIGSLDAALRAMHQYDALFWKLPKSMQACACDCLRTERRPCRTLKARWV